MVTAKITGHTQYAVIATESVWSVFSVEEVFQIVEGTEKYLQSLTKENISSEFCWAMFADCFRERVGFEFMQREVL